LQTILVFLCWWSAAKSCRVCFWAKIARQRPVTFRLRPGTPFAVYGSWEELFFSFAENRGTGRSGRTEPLCRSLDLFLPQEDAVLLFWLLRRHKPLLYRMRSQYFTWISRSGPREVHLSAGRKTAGRQKSFYIVCCIHGKRTRPLVKPITERILTAYGIFAMPPRRISCANWRNGTGKWFSRNCSGSEPQGRSEAMRNNAEFLFWIFHWTERRCRTAFCRSAAVWFWWMTEGTAAVKTGGGCSCSRKKETHCRPYCSYPTESKQKISRKPYSIS